MHVQRSFFRFEVGIVDVVVVVGMVLGVAVVERLGIAVFVVEIEIVVGVGVGIGEVGIG